MPTPPAATPAPAAPKSRFLRTAGITALGLALSFLGLLNLAAIFPVVRDSLGPLFTEHRVASVTALVVTLVVALLVPIVALFLCNRRGWLRWPQLTALGAIVGVTFVYLIWDDAAVRRPLTISKNPRSKLRGSENWRSGFIPRFQPNIAA